MDKCGTCGLVIDGLDGCWGHNLSIRPSAITDFAWSMKPFYFKGYNLSGMDHVNVRAWLIDLEHQEEILRTRKVSPRYFIEYYENLIKASYGEYFPLVKDDENLYWSFGRDKIWQMMIKKRNGDFVLA